jgi:alanine dehydrogenase
MWNDGEGSEFSDQAYFRAGAEIKVTTGEIFAEAPLTNATFSYVLKLANMGYNEALINDLTLRKGLNVYQGKLTSQPKAEVAGLEYTPYEALTGI